MKRTKVLLKETQGLQKGYSCFKLKRVLTLKIKEIKAKFRYVNDDKTLQFLQGEWYAFRQFECSDSTESKESMIDYLISTISGIRDEYGVVETITGAKYLQGKEEAALTILKCLSYDEEV